MSKPLAETAASGMPRRELTLFDSTCIIVGIIIGSTIYKSSPLIASCVPSVGWLVAIWVLGGVLSLVGALCYTELATAYPREGGDYVYLTRAFGSRLGFLFAWAQLWVVRPGSIGAMAYVFASYARRLLPLGDEAQAPLVLLLYAVGSVAVLSLVNALGVQEGKWTQNVLTTFKVLALLAIFAVGMFGSSPAAVSNAPAGDWNLKLAMILIFYAYSGWNEMAYVGAEVRNPERNIFRALILGTVAVTAIYVLLALAFVHALGFAGMRASHEIAADVMQRGLGALAERAIAAVICVSALSAINGLIFTGARIYYAMGTEHRLYAVLGRWSGRFGPVASLAIQALITIGIMLGFGLSTRADGFDAMVTFTSPPFWAFFFLVGLSLFVLRYREPHVVRPFRVPGYPVIPLLFCASSAFMIWTSVAWAIENRSLLALWSLGILAVGGVLCVTASGKRDAA